MEISDKVDSSAEAKPENSYATKSGGPSPNGKKDFEKSNGTPGSITKIEINTENGDGSDQKRRKLDSSSPGDSTDSSSDAKVVEPSPGSRNSPADTSPGGGTSDGEVGLNDAETDTRPRRTTRGNAEVQRGNPPEEVVSQFVELAPLPARLPRVPALSSSEIEELERVLEIDSKKGSDEFSGNSWRDDWAGNLAFVDEEVRNPKARSEKQSFRQPLLDWAHNDSENVHLVWNLCRYVLRMKDTPDAAKKILATADPTSISSIEKSIRRTSYDPTVLQQDGWTTMKATKHEGAIGGSFLIGDRVRWQHADAVIIAYVHDVDIGDMWKALWLDSGGCVSFDLEAEEVLEAKRKWERRQQRQSASTGSDALSRRSARFTVSNDFRVAGIEQGIVLAASYSKGARPGVYWPARVMHASEAYGSFGKRSSSKQKVDLVFLAPYWNPEESNFRGRRVESLSECGTSAFHAGPLLHIETVDATEEMIREYPYDGKGGLDIDQIRMSFRFTGLPRAVFSRFLDSHRLALAFRTYAQEYPSCQVSETDRATAGLFESHPISVLAPTFPSVVLNLPFSHILSKLPHPDDKRPSSSVDDGGQNDVEPVLALGRIVKSMEPPLSLGLDEKQESVPTTPPDHKRHTGGRQSMTPGTWFNSMKDVNKAENKKLPKLEDFLRDLSFLQDFIAVHGSNPDLVQVMRACSQFLANLSHNGGEGNSGLDTSSPIEPMAVTKSWAVLKRHGVEAISSITTGIDKPVLADWRRLCERLYKISISAVYSTNERSDEGVTTVITDYRCNGHLTSTSCFERSVRLPAALKAVRLAGAGSGGNVRLISEIPGSYITYVEQELLLKAHTAPYLKRMKSRCASTSAPDEVVKLTDDSDGTGGEDTMGSRGTWVAAVCGVAAAVNAADMVISGDCVNAFCVTRPPGHHAGRALHPMKAVSNGFCLLNSAACAAIHATTPIHEGGLGLSRVCVIDFDAHHGNGTQDILCSTFDERYLYISMHAGGPEVNGIAHEDDPNHELHDLGGNQKSGGIYPGRCGDTSPHKGILNIPLGAKVTSHDVGTALVRHISPAVESFSPDLIILSAGFDAHKNDPMGLGSLSAEDFGHITEVACQLAFKTCSGRVLSVLEGGYGVPCCRPQREFVQGSTNETGLPSSETVANQSTERQSEASLAQSQRPQPSRLLDLGEELPETMDDQVPYALQRRLEKCHEEGFIECVREHVAALKRCSRRK